MIGAWIQFLRNSETHIDVVLGERTSLRYPTVIEYITPHFGAVPLSSVLEVRHTTKKREAST